jgi:integrase
MEFKPTDAEIKLFCNTYNSKTAIRHAEFSLYWFRYWYDTLEVKFDITEKNIYTVLQNFIKFLENEKTISEAWNRSYRSYNSGEIVKPFSHATIKAYMGYVRTFFATIGIKTDDREYRRLVRIRKPLREIKYTPDLTMVQKMIYGIFPKYQNFLVILIATGARQSEVIQLKVQDISFEKTPASVHFPAEITKTKTERYSFLTKEAENYLRKQITGKAPGDLLFPEINISTFRYVFRRLRQKVGMEAKYSTGVSKLTPHRVRAYANRILQRETDPAFADVILGHAKGLQTYDYDNLDKMREDYSKAEPMLTISPELRLSSQRSTNDKMQAEIDRLKFEIDRLKENKS